MRFIRKVFEVLSLIPLLVCLSILMGLAVKMTEEDEEDGAR